MPLHHRKRDSPSPPSHYSPSGCREDNDNGDGNNDDSNNDVPFVEHWDGRRFWSDRFYLNDHSLVSVAEKSPLAHASASTSSSSPSSSKGSRSRCRCGSRGPPPKFPLIDFVNRSVDVEAAILATFHLHPEWFVEHFPRFCGGKGKGRGGEIGRGTDGGRGGPDTPIPTLVLHGHRGLEQAMERRVAAADELAYRTDDDDDDDDDDAESTTDNVEESLSSALSSSSTPTATSSRFQFFLPATPGATVAARRLVRSETTKLCQVHSRTRRKRPRPAKGVSSDPGTSSTRASQSRSVRATEARFGVHHPKFWLLLEKGSGDLVVVVTTSNLSPNGSGTVEGSWVQRFRRRRSARGAGHWETTRATRTNRNKNSNDSNNDFGPVLQDFLTKLSEATVHPSTIKTKSKPKIKTNPAGSDRSPQPKTPLEDFVQKHLGLDSLSDFASAFHFETAGAYLVPVVPGEHEYDPERCHATANQYHYGRQRVRYVLDHLATTAPRISKKTRDATKSDRLMVQPTSLGGDWSRSEWAEMVREYMGYYNASAAGASSAASNNGDGPSSSNPNHPHKRAKTTSQQHSYYRDDFWVSRQADILWPSDRFVSGQHAAGSDCDNRNPSSNKNSNSNGNGNSHRGEGTPVTKARPVLVTPLQEKQQQQREAIRHSETLETNPSPISSAGNKNTNVTATTTASATASATATANSSVNPNPRLNAVAIKSVLFNSSATFNTCDSEFLSRMALYQSSVPCQLDDSGSGASTRHEGSFDAAAAAAAGSSRAKVPHFKSLARLFPNRAAMRKRGVGAADAYLSWFLMTSACLSQGAQGRTVALEATKNDNGNGNEHEKRKSGVNVSVVGYRNFELGVLFVSHLPKPAGRTLPPQRSEALPPSRQQGRVYCFRPQSCSCENRRDQRIDSVPSTSSLSLSSSSSPVLPPKLVHLPIPYNLRPESYFPKPTISCSGGRDANSCEDEEEHDANWGMKENPFFHEILDSSRCVGNMLLTPFGREEQRKLISDC